MSDVLELGKKRAEELGLTNIVMAKGPFAPTYDCYLASDIHKLLGEGIDLYGNKNCRHWDDHAPPETDIEAGVTHKALLIGIRPIVQESEERKLLREFVSFVNGTFDASNYSSIIQKAKRLLDQK